MILVLGSSGQVASELKRQPDVKAVGRPELDFLDLTSIYDVVARSRPSAVINAAAYTAVDAAEDDAEVAKAVNASAPAELARVCRHLDIPLVHISTDYVFDGVKTYPYSPEDECNPLSVYGVSKRAGEVAIAASGCRHVILRTSWVFSQHGSNFVKTMLRLGRERDRLSVVSDQIGGPTAATAIADCCIAIARRMVSDRGVCGTFHYCGAPAVSWFEFAQETISLSGLKTELTPIVTADYPTRALRPKYTELDCQLTRNTFEIVQPYWKADLADVLKELGEADGQS